MLLQLSVATAQVTFTKTNNLSELLARANNENKLIFIDCYTDWCGWCKVLDEKVFCAGAVADTMNKYFVSTKLEMEKDSIGIILARKYAVMGFPTGLVLNKRGQLVAFLSGYSENYLNRIMPIITAGLDQPIISGYSQNLTPNFPDFYLEVFPMDKKERTAPNDSIVNTFLATQSVITDEVSWNVINRFYYKLNTQQQDRVIANIKELQSLYGATLIHGILSRIFNDKITKSIKAHDEATFNHALQEVTRHLSSPSWLIFNSKLDWNKNDSNWKAAANLITQAIGDTAIGLTPVNINQFAWDLYETCSDKSVLKQAIKWMENSVLTTDPQYNHLDTYAALLYKSGNYNAAKKAAIIAIEAGKKEEKKDVSETENLLKRIDAELLKQSKKK